jgi:hypothetical protein
MHTRAIQSAAMYALNAIWAIDRNCGCEARLTDSPGKPIGCTADYFIAIYDVPQSQESAIGYYPRYGIRLTLSGRLAGWPVTDLTGYLSKSRTGFYDVRDALAAFMHQNRFTILNWANILANADPPSQGILTNMVEAPVITNIGQPVRKQADWWGEAVGQIRTNQSEESRVVGYSSDIDFTAALTMQNAAAQY